MISTFKKQTPPAVLGIYFDEASVAVAQARRSGRTVQVSKTAEFALSGSPLELETEAAGAELRAKLEEHGIKESRCVVALPLRWILSFQTALPDLDESDAAAFLETETERNFPYDRDELFVSTSRARLKTGPASATVAAVRLENILALQAMLKAAGLRVMSFVPAICALPNPAAENPAIQLLLAPHAVELEITAGGGVAMLRSLPNAISAEAPASRILPDVVGRELRVTLGQLSDELRTETHTLRVFGERTEAARLIEELAPRLGALDLMPEIGRDPLAGQGAAPNPAFSCAAHYLLGETPSFEFLPPKVSAWKQFASKTSSRKLAWGGGLAAAAALVIGGAFFIQSWQLSTLRTRWTAMEPRVKELDDTQQLIKRFRPWFDNSFKNLTVLRRLTEAFPVEGVVSAKSVEIRNSSQVSCSGIAKDNEALFKMLDQLRATRDVTDVKRDQIRGKNPVQFSFSYKMGEGGEVER